MYTSGELTTLRDLELLRAAGLTTLQSSSDLSRSLNKLMLSLHTTEATVGSISRTSTHDSLLMDWNLSPLSQLLILTRQQRANLNSLETILEALQLSLRQTSERGTFRGNTG